MGNTVTEEEKTQQPKGTEFRREELSTAFHFTNETTVKGLLDSINLAINNAYRAGYKAHRHDEAEEAECAYERGQLDNA